MTFSPNSFRDWSSVGPLLTRNQIFDSNVRKFCNLIFHLFGSSIDHEFFNHLGRSVLEHLLDDFFDYRFVLADKNTRQFGLGYRVIIPTNCFAVLSQDIEFPFYRRGRPEKIARVTVLCDRVEEVTFRRNLLSRSWDGVSVWASDCKEHLQSCSISHQSSRAPPSTFS